MLKSLTHPLRKTTSGCEIIILQNGAIIDAEAEAMLQALHSRSLGGLAHHLKVLEKRGADNFMSQFYVGYGHKSIGDCGSVTVFVEGCSMLAAKALQDSKLYNGQEASTRYIDFGVQSFYEGETGKKHNNLLEKQRSFYVSLLEPLQEYIENIYPRDNTTKVTTRKKAIKAKVFDICRGFLPAGFTTNLARHGTLRHFSDRIQTLRSHPLQEVREITKQLEQALIEAYPNSFTGKVYEETQRFIEQTADDYYSHDADCSECRLTNDHIDRLQLEKHKERINKRPNGKTELPTYLDLLGTMHFEYQLDFGSFRDIQRHRAPYQRMPLLTTDLGFHHRYFDSLPKNLQQKAKKHIQEIEIALSNIQISKYEKQYLLPMGYKMSCHIMGTLPAMIYLSELRSTTYVHPTLRPIAISIGETIEDKYGIQLFLDKSEDLFDTRRGEHDIVIEPEEPTIK